MPDYQKMYHALFNEISQVIETLKKAQCETEEIYIATQEVLLSSEKKVVVEPPEL